LRARVVSLALFIAATSIHFPALAAPEAKTSKSAIDRARAQFQQGLALETAGDWTGALDLFQQVALVKLTPQVRFHIGLCEEHLGHLVAALGDYELAAHEADQAKVVEVSAQVASRRDGLRARIPQLTIVRGGGAEAALVSLDGVSLGAASVAVKLPIDPGPHTVEARASGFKPFRTTVDVAEKESKSVELTLEPLAAAASGPDTTATASKSTSTVDSAREEPAPSNVVPLVIGGAGVASVGAGVVFLLLRQHAITTLDSECTLPPGHQCPPSAQPTYDQGKTYTLLANVTLGAGVAAIGVGTVLFLTQKKPKSTASVDIAPGAIGAAAGATIVGSF
jgi:hypothetical protein